MIKFYVRGVMLLSCVVSCFNTQIFASTDVPRNNIYRKPLPSLAITFDPAASTDGFSTAVFNQIFDRLFEFDELLNVRSKLAVKWEIDSIGTKYTIYLREDVKFHDGQGLTADDVVFTIRRLLGNKSVVKNEFSIINGVKASSANSVVVELSKPFPLFVQMLASPWAEILPHNFHGKSEADFFAHPIGTGPFLFSSYERGKYVELVANSSYFLGKPKLSKVIFENPMILSNNADTGEKMQRLNAIKGFNTKRYHDLEWFSPNTSEIEVNYRVLKEPISMTSILAFNLKSQPLDNLHVRKAIGLAINKKRIIEDCFPGNTLAGGYVPPGIVGHDTMMSNYEYNPQLARAELKLAKRSNLSRQITVLRPDNYPCKERLANQLENDLAAIGLSVKVIHLPYSVIMEKYYKAGVFDIVNISHTSDFPEAYFMLNYFRSDNPRNYTGFSSREYDNLLSLINHMADKQDRFRAYSNAQKMLYENVVEINLYYPILSIAYQDNVKGIVPSPLGTFIASMWGAYFE